VVVSPGLSLEQGEIADALARVRQQFPSLCIWGELDVFAIALAGLKQFYNYGPKVIGITGSNGKTTVTAFTAHMTRALGYSSVVAGNISPALLTVLLEQLERESPSNWPQVWVLELSSFQLAGWAGVVDCYDWQLDASVVLNISEDHLDWHGSMGTYQNAKIKLLQHSQCVVLNHDEPLLSDAIHKRGLGKDFIFFGLNIPTKNPSVLRWSLHDQQIGFYEEGRFVPVILATNLKIRGLHNVSNTLAVLSLCEAAGLLDSLSISVKRLDQSILEKLQRGLISYQGEPHRVEWVGQVEGIDFFDDSKGTNVGATQAALKGLSGQGFDVFVILGGEGKGQNFLPLAQDVVRYTKGVALIGRDAPLIEEAIVQADVDGFICCQVVGELTGAVDLLFKWAKEQKRLLLANTSAQKPQIQIAVLLSPACASFDQFRGYAHRAEVFVQKVKSLC
jgi:UDP-N-acetylmuramoylalanine--D-glutamate ligase